MSFKRDKAHILVSYKHAGWQPLKLSHLSQANKVTRRKVLQKKREAQKSWQSACKDHANLGTHSQENMDIFFK